MYQDLLSSRSFFCLLLQLDQALADDLRAAGCPSCHAALHRGDYWRKPRGGPRGLPEEFGRRFSTCCSRDGCRKRATPVSVRFLSRKVYLGAIVILLTVARHGLTAGRARQLHEQIGASRRTLDRWRDWWREVVPLSRFWQVYHARFSPPVKLARLPASALERFRGSLREQLLALLNFLQPITSGSAPGCLPI